jgi:hypothetical protein
MVLRLLPVILLLHGCAVPVLVGVGVSAVSVGVNEATGKTVSDHVVSTINQKDCRVSRAVDGKDMCQDEVVDTTTPKPKTVVAKNTVTDDYEKVLAQRKRAQ